MWTGRAPAAIHASVRDRLKAEAESTSRPYNELLREFTHQRFLARVFADVTSPWVLKGGTGLLVRLPGARHSRDIDLLHRFSGVGQAVADLASLGGVHPMDPFTFVMGSAVEMTGAIMGATIKVAAHLGARLFCEFPIDVSTSLTLVAPVERQQPRPVIDVPDLQLLPQFTLFPLPDQVADKVCAMYERHGAREAPSSRYRDLVDLLLVVENFELDATETLTAMTAESDRRGLVMPHRVEAPGPGWALGYRALARRTSLGRELHDVTTALGTVGACLDPLLARQVTTGRWDPTGRRWC